MIEGTYLAKVRNAELSMSSTGKEQVAVTFEVEGQGTITWYGYFTEDAVKWTLDALENCGFTGDDITALEQCKGHEAEIVVEDDEYKGKVRSKVKWVNSAGGPRLAPMTKAGKVDFANKLKGKLRARVEAKKEPGDVPFD
jgi:hypothetical protein